MKDFELLCLALAMWSLCKIKHLKDILSFKATFGNYDKRSKPVNLLFKYTAYAFSFNSV